MIFEHEIPGGSRLYFGEAAKKKRAIETIASSVLDEAGFEEIVTPLFSYHQHQSVSDERALIRVNDTHNYNMSLRADSTIDVVRIINKRLGRNTTHKKWFYIQPIYSYPSFEQYQVGAEYIDEQRLSRVLNEAMRIFEQLHMTPLLQISNINIPKKLSQLLDIPLESFRHINVEQFLSRDEPWLKALVYLHDVEQIESVMAVVPESIKEELATIKELCDAISYKHVIIAPLYYADMLYYDELFFRVIEGNELFASGGRYGNDDITSVGFAIYTDALIEALG